MDLKNALAVCLISMFSATLVVLIARALDQQAAARLEPQLEQIVREIRGLREQGGLIASTSSSETTSDVRDGLVVYYFHGSFRCPTCRAIESQSYQTVISDFSSQLDDGTVTWQILNYEQPANAALVQKFDVQVPVVVLAKMEQGEIQEWTRLDKVWGLVSDPTAFRKFVSEEVRQMLDLATPDAVTDDENTEEAAGSDQNSTSVPADLPLP